MVGAWQYTKRLWQHRFSRQGPHHERWRGLYVPLTSETGLAKVQCTWGGVFVAEAIAALRPTWRLLLSDTDVAPTALFEVSELVDLCGHLMHEELRFGEPGILIGTEPHQDINAGMAIFLGSQKHPAARLPVVQNLCSSTGSPRKPREELPHKPAALMPPVTLTEPQFQGCQQCTDPCYSCPDGCPNPNSVGWHQSQHIHRVFDCMGDLRRLDVHTCLAHAQPCAMAPSMLSHQPGPC